MSNLAPPPYSTDFDSTGSGGSPAPSETAVPLQLNASDISGIRELILDNAPTLYALANGFQRTSPFEFRLCTCREPQQQTSERIRAGEVHAAVYIVSVDKDYWTKLALFVQGPQAPTREGALKALLDKMEAMIGRRRGRTRLDMGSYLES